MQLLNLPVDQHRPIILFVPDVQDLFLDLMLLWSWLFIPSDLQGRLLYILLYGFLLPRKNLIANPFYGTGYVQK